MSTREGPAGIDVDEAIDALYQAPLDRFTADRNALAAAVRKSGDRAAADRVKALSKPGATAWAVNQAWWTDQAAFQAMLDAGAAERAAHVARARGQDADVRAAAETRQQAVDRVIDAAVQALGGAGAASADARHRIAGTVEALASGGMPADTRPGRLAKDLQASGLEALGALAGLAPSTSPPLAARPPRPTIVARGPGRATPRDGDKARSKAEERAEEKAEAAAQARAARFAEARTRLGERERALRAAVKEAADAAAAEKKARAALDTAVDRVAALDAQLEAARETERAARRSVAQAAKAAAEAEMIRARTARDVGAAREDVESLRP